MKINLNHLNAFFITAQHGSIKDASNFIHVTPSTISKQIKELEEYLGEALFYREHGRLKLSSFGMETLRQANPIFDAIGHFDHFTSKKTAKQTRTLRVGCSPLFYSSIMSQLVRPIPSSPQNLQNIISIYCISNYFLKEVLQEGKVDVVLTDYVYPADSISALKIREYDLSWVVGAKYLDSNESTRIPHILANLPILTYNFTTTIRTDMDSFFEQSNIRPTIALQVDSFSAAKEAVSNSKLVSVIPTCFIENELRAGILQKIAPYKGFKCPLFALSVQSRKHDELINSYLSRINPNQNSTLH